MPEEARPRAVLVRHGETEWSRSGKHTSTTDIELTEVGIKQAEALREVLRANFQFRRVLVSPRRRALMTARLAGFGDDLENCPDLAEWDYGQYEGMTTAEIRRIDPGWSLWRDGTPGGEAADEVGRRADRVIDAVRRETVGGAARDTLLIAHGHILRVLAARWLGLAPADGRFFALDCATVSVLGGEREVPAIWLWNESVDDSVGDSP
jgi:broad specificity phosphatase PhoE